MSHAVARWPYPTVLADGQATVEDDGENQVCECGNDSWTQDWHHADCDGRLSFDASGSSDPDEFVVCPVCGRVYPNSALFGGGIMPAVARYEISSAEFVEAARRYERDAYGSGATEYTEPD